MYKENPFPLAGRDGRGEIIAPRHYGRNFDAFLLCARCVFLCISLTIGKGFSDITKFSARTATALSPSSRLLLSDRRNRNSLFRLFVYVLSW